MESLSNNCNLATAVEFAIVIWLVGMKRAIISAALIYERYQSTRVVPRNLLFHLLRKVKIEFSFFILPPLDASFSVDTAF